MSCLIFKSKKLFYKWIEEKCSTFDVNASLPKSRFSFFDKEGSFYKCGNMIQFVNNINMLAGEAILDPNKSKAIGAYTYKVFLPEEVTKKEEVSESPVIEILSPEAVVEDKKEESEELVQEVIDNLEDKLDDIDWPRLEALKNTKEDKMFLDTYAEEKFGIKLKRTKKIEGMLEDFKSGLKSI